MKRLIKKSGKEVYIPVSQLDEADIKFNRCPFCKSSQPLERIDGFKICKTCSTRYKTFDGQSYVISK